MLALLKNNAVLNRLEIVGQFAEGSWVDLPDGSRVSPAYDGWALRGYELHTIQPADPVPSGYRVVSSSVQMVNGLPTWVDVIEAVPVTLDDYKAAFDNHLDAVAHSKGYDNRLTIATYTGSTNPVWAGEAAAYLAWRDAALASMFAQLAAVEAGGDAPTVEEFLAALPAIEWPTNP
ncbi:hypothetical protein HRR99_05800 [Agrobacterium vaccinii]|uniref:hypothetical protein n=1 Tax=Agrobacterium vaccinii TaxID=2735528 RepID=UPI001E46D94B|nr:hypothetical protein [Agrobacterium vaccinii]UHS61061.1 hypothetical protein HRR99_05800 [Agrobacterium vaccinii]